MENFLGDLATIIGVLIAIVEYRRRNYSDKVILLQSVKTQLNSIAPWASFSDSGYQSSPTPQQQKRYMQVYDHIFPIDNSVISQITLLPGGIDFGENFHSSITNINQQILNIQELVKYRNDFINAHSTQSDEINRRYKEYTDGVMEDNFSIDDFLASLEEKDKFVARGIYQIYKNLHTKYIGTNSSGGLKDSVGKVHNKMIEEEKKLKKWNNSFFEKMFWWGAMLVLITMFIKLIDVIFFDNNISFYSNILYSILSFLLLKINKLIY